MIRTTIAVGAALGALSLSPAVAGAQTVTLPPLSPEVAALLPSSSACQVTLVDADSVRVAGSVDPNGLATSYRVEYGLAGILGLSLSSIDIGSSMDPVAISTQLDDLAPGASYSCRIVALNSAGESAGSTTTFLAGLGGPGGLGGLGGSGGTGATPSLNPVTGQLVPAGSRGSVACTLTGTNGSDRLTGTRGADVICGLGGADRIVGLAGNDTLIGGAGTDRIRVGAGKDRIYGNGGKDRAGGNRGKDRVQGNRGNDRLAGGKGNDAFSGGRGADRMDGAKGRDRLTGGAGNDRLMVSSDHRGGDRVHGGRGRDRARVNRGDRRHSSVERVRVSS